MATKAEEKDSSLIVIDNNIIQAIQNSLSILEEKFDLRWHHQDFQFKNLTETIDTKFRGIDQRFTQADQRIDDVKEIIDTRFKSVDERLNGVEKVCGKIEGRFWQVIIVLLGYPIGLIVGKLCHVF